MVKKFNCRHPFVFTWLKTAAISTARSTDEFVPVPVRNGTGTLPFRAGGPSGDKAPGSKAEFLRPQTPGRATPAVQQSASPAPGDALQFGQARFCRPKLSTSARAKRPVGITLRPVSTEPRPFLVGPRPFLISPRHFVAQCAILSARASY